MFKVREKLPSAIFGKVENGEIVTVNSRDVFEKGPHILVGLPGVFTPICSQDHIPSLIKQAADIKARGIHRIVVLSDDNVWALDHWKNTFDGHEALEFYSDGNREFLDQIKMHSDEKDLFLAGHYSRFYAVIDDNVIKRVRFETTVLETVCTNGESILSDIGDTLERRAMSA